MDKKKIRTQVPEIDPDPALGLTTQQVCQRAEAGWDNRISNGAVRSEKKIIARHCFTFFNLVFAVLALILVLVRSSVANMGFLLVVLLNTTIGIVQDIRAKRAVEKLTLMAQQTLKTVRNGGFAEVPSQELVRDDIVIFVGGNQICADAVVRQGQLQVDESLITGEPDPVVKNPGDELMSGSFVVAGRAAVQLIRVGDDSYAARLSAEAKKNPKAGKSEMMRDLDRLIRFLSAVLVPLGLFYFISKVAIPGAQTRTAAEQTVAAVVSIIPQGLYLLTSIAMAASSLKLARQRVLVQDMSCIETLARVDVLCVDKTGTITEPGMEVQELIPLGGTKPEYLQELLRALYGMDEPENETARALQALYGTGSAWERTHTVPFTSAAKWSGAVFARQGAFVTGAPEFVMGSRYAEIRDLVTPWNEKGYRVLLTAGYEGTLTPGTLAPERLTPLALIVLTNPLREEARQTLDYFARQGVEVKVLSGDNPVTAAEVARRAGIRGAERYVDCSRLHTPEEFLEAAGSYTVFGRVTPDRKRDLVKALKKKNHTVAMTGDGVNDVLAMREADCAVAMAGGAQAASQVAQLVLLDGDFAAMPHIVGEGRRVINNIRRAAALFLVKNIFTIAMVLLSLVSALVFPFQPVTLTLISGLTVGIPSFFFALEPNYERETGKFLSQALRRAVPPGAAGFLLVTLTQILAWALGMDDVQMATVCAAVMGNLGLLTLWQVSRPLTRLRRLVLAAMAVGLAGAFLLLGDLFLVDVYSLQTVLLCLLMMTAAAVLLFWLEWGLTRLEKRKRR